MNFSSKTLETKTFSNILNIVLYVCLCFTFYLLGYVGELSFILDDNLVYVFTVVPALSIITLLALLKVRALYRLGVVFVLLITIYLSLSNLADQILRK